ncbi:MAG: hypothetical protein HOM03_05085 [Marinovum sp.]|nr:hypothetical protein [Marinovum sp.]MBT4873305.1 hypothetical protein [Marinovum sp.]MBT6096933.1 hypothetical protein [Marinovum sp.]MBT6532334.1 hypothetical protein [Marinovum sp.]MBT7908382.1 hypothetical protein [Marinovum sp.]
MTPEEQAIVDDKTRIEITRLRAEVDNMQLETILKMGMETNKINAQRLWIPIFLVTGFLVASVTIIDNLMS